MSLEDNIYWLTQAIKAQSEASAAAVAEIIRQRDRALKDLEAAKSQIQWERSMKNDYDSRLQSECRRNSALRGVITRMKSKSV